MTTEKIKNTQNDLGIKIFIGGIFLIFGLATLQYYVGILFLVICFIILTYRSGIEIDIGNNKIRKFSSYLWITKGEWTNLSTFGRILIHKTRKGLRVYGGRTNVSTTSYKIFYEVTLIPENRQKPIKLFSSVKKDKSIAFAEIWKHKLNLPLSYG